MRAPGSDRGAHPAAADARVVGVPEPTLGELDVAGGVPVEGANITGGGSGDRCRGPAADHEGPDPAQGGGASARTGRGTAKRPARARAEPLELSART